MATSKLQRRFGDMLDSNFPQYRIRENYRPDWLISSDNTWLELDFFIEELKIAFEVQGDQHFTFTPFFHKTKEDFEKRKRHDQEKRDLCYGHGIRLIEICTEMDAHTTINELADKYQTRVNNQRDFGYCKPKLRRRLDKDFEKAERLQRCIEKIRQYESGAIDAPKEKVEAWYRIVENNGQDDTWKSR